MNLLHMISGGDTGGARTHVLSLLGKLRERHEVLLVCFLDGPFANDARRMGIETLILPSKNPFTLRRTLRALIRERGIELVHCHGARANVTARFLGNRVGVPRISTVHSDPWLDYMGRPVRDATVGAANRRALRRMDALTAVSDRMRKLLCEKGLDGNRIYVLYNGVTLDCSVATPRDAFLAQVGLSVPENGVVFGIAARLSPVKDIPTLLRAFAEAVKQAPYIRLLIAGDGEDRAALEAQAQALCPEGSVCFAGWVQDVNSFCNAIDVNLLTSLSETFPYSLLEGGKMGCPTIASDVGGVPELVVNGQTGFLFRPGDAQTLCRHILTLAENTALRKSMRTAIREKVFGEFSVDAMTAAQENIYREIIKKQ